MHPFGPRAPASDGGFVLLVRAFVVSLVLHLCGLLTASVETPPQGSASVVQASLRTAAMAGLKPAGDMPRVARSPEGNPQSVARPAAAPGSRLRQDGGLARGGPPLADVRDDAAATMLSPRAVAEFRLLLAERLQGKIRLSPGETWRLAMQWSTSGVPELFPLAIAGDPPSPAQSAAMTQEAALINRPATLRRIELLFVAAIE